jgi:hypothetical protein
LKKGTSTQKESDIILQSLNSTIESILNGASYFDSFTKGLGPKFFVMYFAIYELINAGILNVQKALDVAFVIINKFIVEFQNVHMAARPLLLAKKFTYAI